MVGDQALASSAASAAGASSAGASSAAGVSSTAGSPRSGGSSTAGAPRQPGSPRRPESPRQRASSTRSSSTAGAPRQPELLSSRGSPRDRSLLDSRGLLAAGSLLDGRRPPRRPRSGSSTASTASAASRLGAGAGRLGRGSLGGGVATGGGDGGLVGVAAEQLALPVGQRLLGAGLGALDLHAGAGDQALGDGVGDHAGEQADGADRVVVARDREVDQVGVAVGVEDADDRDAQLARLLDGEVLLVGVDDPDGGGRAGHLADAAERLVELVALAAHLQQLLLGAAGAGDVVEVDLVELLEAVDPLVHGLEVGEHAAEPALVDVGHPDAHRLLGDRLLGLLLGAHEHDRAALGDGLLDEGVGAVDVGQRLLQVDDVDAVALGHDEALHLRVPATGLVPEVDAALEELAHGDDCHEGFSCVGRRPRVPDLESGRAGSAAPVVFSCRGRRVPVALTPARGPTRPSWPGPRSLAHGRSVPQKPGAVVVCGRAKSAPGGAAPTRVRERP